MCAGLQGLLQIDHIYQLSAVLDDGVVVMIGEEAGDQVRANVSASFVKTECAGNIPGADEKRPVTPPVVRLQKFERLSSVSFPLILEGYSQILDLSDSVGFVRDGAFRGDLLGADVRDDAFGDDLSVVTGYEHFAPFQVAVDHGFLFVGQQEQVEEAFFVRGDFFESQRYDGRVFLSGWGT